MKGLITIIIVALGFGMPAFASTDQPISDAVADQPATDSDADVVEIARTALKQGDYSQAVILLEGELKLRPEDAAVMQLLLESYRAVFSRDRLKSVFNTAEDALTANPLAQLGKQALDEMQVERLGKLKELSDFSGLRALADVDSMESLVDALKLKDVQRAGDYLSLAAFYEKIGDMDGLVEGLEEVLKINPDHATAHLKLGMLEAEEGNWDKAENHFMRYLGSGEKKSSMLAVFALAYVNASPFAIGSLTLILLGSILLLLHWLGGGRSKAGLIGLLVPVFIVILILVLACANWMLERSLAGFLVLFALDILMAMYLVVRLLRRYIGPVVVGIERVLGRLWSGGIAIFSGRVSGKLAGLSNRYLILMLILLPPLAFAILSSLQGSGLRLAVIVLAGFLFFTIIGSLAYSFLIQNVSLARTLKQLSLFNTIPFLFVFLYLAGGVAEKFLSLSFNELDSWELQTAIASLALYLFGLFFAMYLASVQSRVILKPVRALIDGVARVEAGEFNLSIEVDSANELGKMSHGFNRMVEGLKQREFIRHTFGKFVDKRVVERVLARGAIDLGGRTVPCAVLFSDIRGFTSRSEKVTPEELVDTLNDYFTRMVRVVESEKGLVNKFIGDAMMVVWGGLLEQEPDVKRAVMSGLGMQEELRRFNQERTARGEWTLAMGIGINMGEVVAGHLGSHDRLEWTVIGDNVNLAQRAESIAKDGQVLVAPQAFEPVADLFEFERLDPVKVKGKQEAISFYNVTGMKEQKI